MPLFSESQLLSRRTLLRLAGLAAMGKMLTTCGSPPTPTPLPTRTSTLTPTPTRTGS